VVQVTLNNQLTEVKFKFEVKGALLWVEMPAKKDYTTITKLTTTELVFKDQSGVTANFRRSGDRYTVPVPERALEILDAMWDNYFQFNNAAESLRT
jgi:hypothetical protein